MAAKKILVVDDDLAYVHMVREFLSLMGHTVFAAENGSRAYEQVRLHIFDLVLLDINMPKMDGIETIRAIRERQPSVKIVLVSGEGDALKLGMALSSGANSLLRKPFELDDLLRHVSAN